MGLKLASNPRHPQQRERNVKVHLAMPKAGAWQVALSLLVDFKDCDVKLNTVVYNAAILACRGPGRVVVRCGKVNNSDMHVA